MLLSWLRPEVCAPTAPKLGVVSRLATVLRKWLPSKTRVMGPKGKMEVGQVYWLRLDSLGLER